MNKNTIKTWMSRDGVSFLADIGVKRSQAVLDFGCGEGHYSIPAARIVGEDGTVYAVDEDSIILAKLVEMAKAEGLRNITPVEGGEDLKLNLESKSIDVALLYDVLHYLDVNKRRMLYKDIYKILKKNGLLSVYPKHNKHDEPLWYFSSMELSDIIEEIEHENFYFERRSLVRLIHDNSYNKGYILSFRKNV